MEITLEIKKEGFEKLLKDAAHDWDSREYIEDSEKGKGYKITFSNLDTDGAEIEDNELRIYGGTKDERVWVNMEFGYDNFILGKMVEYVVKSLNRFKSAMESLNSI